MPADDLVRERDRVAAAVREAGALALKTFRRPVKSWTKLGSSPVSEADLAVDAFLRERLARSGVAWLSEESADDPVRLQSAELWVVDPIDGTRGYLAGAPDWTISVALVRGHRPVIATLYAPASDELFVAVAGAGATLNGVPIAVSAGENLQGARVAGPKRRQERFAALAVRVTLEPRISSLALRIARVAAGSIDIAFAGPHSHDWDLAAADLLVHEAGGALTTFSGEPVMYNRPEPVHEALVAAGRARHKCLLRLLQDRHAEFA